MGQPRQVILQWEFTETAVTTPWVTLLSIFSSVCVYMGGCFYRTSHCFAFVIVRLLCVCFFTSLPFVFSLLLLCPALPVSKRAWLTTYCDLISLPRYVACKNIQLLHVCEIEHDELRLSLEMRVKLAQAVRLKRVDS